MIDLERVKEVLRRAIEACADEGIGPTAEEELDALRQVEEAAVLLINKDAELARLRSRNEKLEAQLGGRWVDKMNELETELARLREALEQVTANRDSLLLRVEETEDDCRRLREDLFASRQAALSEGVRYAELLEAVKAVVRQTGPPQPRSNRDMAPPSLEAWNRLRQLIEENDG